MFPESYHPVLIDRSRDLSHAARYTSRTQNPPKYYFIDFGISRQYKPEDLPPIEGIILGGDKSPPEHKNSSGAWDPFPTDVYFLGNLAREEYLQVSALCAYMLIFYSTIYASNRPSEALSS